MPGLYSHPDKIATRVGITRGQYEAAVDVLLKELDRVGADVPEDEVVDLDVLLPADAAAAVRSTLTRVTNRTVVSAKDLDTLAGIVRAAVDANEAAAAKKKAAAAKRAQRAAERKAAAK